MAMQARKRLFVVAIATLAAQAHAAGYQVIDLGPIYQNTGSPCEGCSSTRADTIVALSDGGIALLIENTSTTYSFGSSSSSPPYPVAVDTATLQKVPLQFPSTGYYSLNLSVNSNDQVAVGLGSGSSYLVDLHGRQALAMPVGATGISVRGINAAAQTTGVAWSSSTTGLYGYIASSDGSAFKMLGLDVLPKSINARGQVAGSANASTPNSIAFKTSLSGTVLKLGKLFGDQSSVANAINDSGTVVGRSTSSAGVARAFVTNAFGLLVNLNSRAPTGYVANEAVGINNAGTVIGNGRQASVESPLVFEAPFVYASGKLTPLSTERSLLEAGWTMTAVQAINNKGQIAGVATSNNDGQRHNVVLTPVP